MRLIRQEGDTIIEVMFAVAVFAMVAVGSMMVMNQGTAIAQRSLEITQVREQMDAQAEAIRYIHQAYVASYQEGVTPAGTAQQWVNMKNKGVANASAFGQVNGVRCPDTVPQHGFILNARQATVWNNTPAMQAPANGTLPPYAQVAYNGDSSISQAYGIWVEAVPSNTTSATGFVDFHIRACWESAGSSAPVTLGTIVRLYEPRQ